MTFDITDGTHRAGTNDVSIDTSKVLKVSVETNYVSMSCDVSDVDTQICM